MANEEYINNLLFEVMIENSTDWSEINCKDYRGNLELYVNTPKQMRNCIMMIEKSGWKSEACSFPQRLLLGTVFDLESPETGSIHVLISIKSLNDWANRYWEGDRQTKTPVKDLTNATNEFVHSKEHILKRISGLIQAEKYWLKTRTKKL